MRARAVVAKALKLTSVVSGLVAAFLFLSAHAIWARAFDNPELAPVLRVLSLSVPLLALMAVALAATQGFGVMCTPPTARRCPSSREPGARPAFFILGLTGGLMVPLLQLHGGSWLYYLQAFADRSHGAAPRRRSSSPPPPGLGPRRHSSSVVPDGLRG
jgi:O-antigen/teichoic acid export membrane protein